MDRLIYTAMNGARQILEQQATNSHNLANASTTGFRAQMDAFRAVPLTGGGLPTRVMAAGADTGIDFTAGPVQHTGRDLDVAVQGNGWFVVEAANGEEAFTRNGAFRLSENGLLQTSTGLNVMGDGGPISLPPGMEISVGRDGTISGIAAGTKGAAVTVLGRLKLVNPPQEEVMRGDDGLFRLKNGGAAEPDAGVSVAGAALEGSNVNVIDSMINMISLGRQFDLHMNLLKNAENNAAKAGQILNLS